MKLVVFCSIFVFLIIQVQGETVCWGTNSENGLFYNLTGMIRPSNTEDYQYIVPAGEGEAFQSIYMNICANVKEACSPATPVCDMSTKTTFPYITTSQSYGSLSETTWLPYQPSDSTDGITVNYNSAEVCGDSSTYQSLIHVQCELSESGVIDSVSKSSDGCTTEIFMRSQYGCGYPENEPLTCSDYYSVEPVACTTSGQKNFNCQAGEFVVSVTGNQNVPKYSFYMNSEYSYDYDYGTTEYAYDDTEDDEVYGGEYKIQFQQIFETDSSGHQVTHSKVSLPSLSWEMTMPVALLHDDDECTQETTFNITNTDGPNWTKLVFVNHLYLAGNTSSLKFDVVVEDYEWVGDDTSNLVLSVDYSSNGAGNASISNSTTATVGDSYLYISPQAYGYPNSSDPLNNQTVAASYTNSGKIEISYTHFTGSLVHDPTFGIKLPVPTPPTAPCSDGACTFHSYSLASKTSSVPSLSFTYQSNEWKANFAVLREVTVTNDSYETVGSSSMSLGDYTWSSTTPASVMLPDGTAQVSFTLSTGSSDRWGSLSILVQSSLRSGITHFTVELQVENYVWVSEQSSLQLEIDVAGPGSISYAYDTVLVGDGYIQIPVSSTAQSASVGVQSPLMSLYYSDAVYTTVAHFDGSLSSSFIMGVNSDSDPIPYQPQNMVAVEGEAEITSDSNDSGSDWWIWVLVSVGLVAVIAGIAFAVLFVIKRRKASYEPVV